MFLEVPGGSGYLQECLRMFQNTFYDLGKISKTNSKMSKNIVKYDKTYDIFKVLQGRSGSIQIGS